MASNDKSTVTRKKIGSAIANGQHVQPTGLSLQSARSPAGHDKPGADPYNTSGGFDRTKNWARVGKR